MIYRIEFTDGLMHVMDEDGDGHDAHVVRADGTKEAETKIDEWAAEYDIDPRRARRALRNLIRLM
jgi:hypothetical protein